MDVVSLFGRGIADEEETLFDCTIIVELEGNLIWVILTFSTHMFGRITSITNYFTVFVILISKIKHRLNTK